MKKRVSGWLVAVIIILIGAIGFSGYKVASIWLEYKKGDDEYANLQELVQIDRSPTKRADGSTPPAEATAPADQSAPLGEQTAPAADATAPEQSAASPGEKTAATEATTDGAAQPTSTDEQIAATKAPQDGAAQPTSTDEQIAATEAPQDGTVQPTSTDEQIAARKTPQDGAAQPTSTDEQIAATKAPTDGAAQPTSADTAQPTASATLQPQILVDFAPLLEINADAVAWIYSEGTEIDYPIVQGEDNAFYLDRLFSGDWGSAGTIFMDIDNAPDFTDRNTVVYGHHMNNGSMFASLSEYRAQEYYELHPTMHLYTPTGDYTIEIFSGYARDASAIPHDFDTPQEFLAYVDMARGLSNFKSDVVVEEGDRIITLSTCSYVTDDARYVVHGKLVPLYE